MKRPLTNIVIFGAYSAIAEATARQLVSPKTTFFLVGRDETRLDTIAQDLTVRGTKAVHTRSVDLTCRETFEVLVDEVFDTLGKVDAVLLAHGVLPDQAQCMALPTSAYKAFEDNAISHIGLLTLIANRLESQGSGTIGVITSVAGDRGRKSNYVYGAAKKMVSTFLEGLRHRLAPVGVAVVDIRPGFVDTPMTRDFEKGALWASPEKVASGIVKAISTGRTVAYVPAFWQIIMLVIRVLPKVIFNKLNF
jgi:decaprenylphospho-beta-D-erythro-pentofuranosid-2-ulose 2-reductase